MAQPVEDTSSLEKMSTEDMEEGMEDYVDEAMDNEEEATDEDEERGHLLRRTFQPYGLRTYGAGLHRGLSYGLNYRPAAVYGHNLGFRPTVYGAAYGARPEQAKILRYY